jgi:hypothetical protein
VLHNVHANVLCTVVCNKHPRRSMKSAEQLDWGTVHLQALMPHAACKTSMPHANQVSD